MISPGAVVRAQPSAPVLKIKTKKRTDTKQSVPSVKTKPSDRIRTHREAIIKDPSAISLSARMSAVAKESQQDAFLVPMSAPPAAVRHASVLNETQEKSALLVNHLGRMNVPLAVAVMAQRVSVRKEVLVESVQLVAHLDRMNALLAAAAMARRVSVRKEVLVESDQLVGHLDRMNVLLAVAAMAHRANVRREVLVESGQLVGHLDQMNVLLAVAAMAHRVNVRKEVQKKRALPGVGANPRIVRDRLSAV
jgi:hypothetical protein